MTVLKGPLAVKQSKALIRTFKKMKDYILENRDLIGQREILQLSMETANNRIEINKINSDMISLEKQISDVAEGLKDVVTKSELADMMNSFVSDDDDKWLMFNAKFSSADEIYESIYKQAKSSIYVVDNYIGLRTLVHLKNSPAGVDIVLFSDNVGNNKLHNIEFKDFCKEYPTVKLSMKKTGGIFHDRFIVLDYGTADERVFLCGICVVPSHTKGETNEKKTVGALQTPTVFCYAKVKIKQLQSLMHLADHSISKLRSFGGINVIRKFRINGGSSRAIVQAKGICLNVIRCLVVSILCNTV